MTPNKLALLSGALPSGLALEELPATQRELDLLHVMRLTKKEQSCSQHLLTLSQHRRPRGEWVTADHNERKRKNKVSSTEHSVPPPASQEEVSAELTTSLGGELGNSGTAQRAAGRKGQRDLERRPQNNSLFV